MASVRPINAAGASGSAASAAAPQSTNKVITANEPSVLQKYEPVPTASFARFAVTSPQVLLDAPLGQCNANDDRDKERPGYRQYTRSERNHRSCCPRRMPRGSIPGKCQVRCLQLAFLYSKSSCSVRRWLFSIAVAKPSSFASFSHVLAALRYAFLACGNSGPWASHTHSSAYRRHSLGSGIEASSFPFASSHSPPYSAHKYLGCGAVSAKGTNRKKMTPGCPWHVRNPTSRF